MQRELVLGVIVLLFLYRVVLACLCMWVGGCVSESIYKGISPGGVDASLQWRESKGGGGELVHSRCSKHPTSSKKKKPRLNWLCTGTVQYFIYLFGLGGKCMFSGVGYQWQEGSKSDTTNEAVKVARQLGPEANIPRSHILLWSQWNLTARRKERREEKKKRKEKKTIISPTGEKEEETKRAPLYHRRPWWNELWMCGGD